jgi:hypothetical protein
MVIERVTGLSVGPLGTQTSIHGLEEVREGGMAAVPDITRRITKIDENLVRADLLLVGRGAP